MHSTEHSPRVRLDAEAFVAIVGLAISLAIAAAGVAAIANGRVLDDTRPATTSPSASDDDATGRSYVFGA
jgi:hypothetical protein